MWCLNFIFAIVLVEAITEIVVKSELFEPIRKFFFVNSKYKFCSFVHSLLDCGYCFSVWVGWFIAILFTNQFITIFNSYVDWFFIGIVLHRLSNMLHFLIDRLRSENG